VHLCKHPWWCVEIFFPVIAQITNVGSNYAHLFVFQLMVVGGNNNKCYHLFYSNLKASICFCQFFCQEAFKLIMNCIKSRMLELVILKCWSCKFISMKMANISSPLCSYYILCLCANCLGTIVLYRLLC